MPFMQLDHQARTQAYEMYAEVDVFISNYTLVDADIFQLWTEGYSSNAVDI